MSRSSQKFAPNDRKRKISRRPLLLEALERRSVLCTVVCDLSNGVLDVGVGPGQDTVSVQMDPSTQTLQVSNQGQVVQAYSASSIQNLRVHGLADNAPVAADRIQIDRGVVVPVEVNSPASGESTPSAATVALPPASFFFPLAIQSAGASNYGSEHAAHLAALSVNGGTFSGSGVTPLSSAGDSSQNSDPHSGHGSYIVLNGGSDNHDHDFQPNNSSGITALSTSGLSVNSNSSAVSYRNGRNSDGDGHHLLTFTKKGGEAELSPKFCTTTPFAKQLVTTADGKPECNCDNPKKSFGLDLASLLNVNSTNGAAQGWGIAALPSFRPSQLDFRLGRLTADDVCTERCVDEVIREITGEAGTASPSNANSLPTADAALAVFAGDWSDELRYAGLALMTAGIALLPMLLAESMEDRNEERPSNWCRGGFELLAS